MVQDKNALIRSYDNLSERYDEATNTFHHRITSYVIMENLLLHLPDKKNLKILDSGGGTGKFSCLLRKLGYDITLSDISPKSVEFASKKFAENSLTIPTYVQDSESTNFHDKYFDVVMLNGGVISYTPHPQKLIEETKRILKKNGIIWFDFLNSLGWAIETQNMRFKADIALEGNGLIKMDDWDYPARIMSLESARNLLRESGFRIKSEYGLIVLSHSLPLDQRYGKDYEPEIVKKYQELELTLSRKKECLGAAWSCIICAESE